MNTKNTETPSLPINKTQKRLYAAALDSTFEHDSIEAMVEYLENPTSYFGQILYCKDRDALFKIANNNGEKKLEEMGAADPAKIPFKHNRYPQLINLKVAIDYLLANMGSGGDGGGGGVTLLSNHDVYYGTSTLDGLEQELTKEYIIQNFQIKEISLPDYASSNEIERTYEHIKLDFGVNDTPKYFFAAFPIKKRNIKARDLNSSFGDGWFNWNKDASSDFLKIITLPDSEGILRDYILLRSDNMLLDGSNWLFYFIEE